MCLAIITSVRSIDGDTAYTSDGRMVKLGSLRGSVSSGDWLEVYADIALKKMSAKESETIRSARGGQ